MASAIEAMSSKRKGIGVPMDDQQLQVTRKTKSWVIPSSSSSSSTSTGEDNRLQKHEVFLSFRGADTRTGFTGYLYDALKRRGIDVYMDDQKLRKGKFIRPELLEAIEASRYAVVVISANYASSKWCLVELAHIVQCMEEGKLVVIPVFYHVDPSDVRHQGNTFQKAFAKHEKYGSISAVQVKTWRAACRQVGSIAGWHVKGDRYEHKHARDIVQRIDQDLQNVFLGDGGEDLVGIERHAEEVIRLLCLQSNSVSFLVIHGMSGIGKTTLAEYVYQKIRNQFDCSSFVLSIKDVSIESNHFCDLQKKILQSALDEKNVRIPNVIDGVGLLQRRLRGLKFLLVLDDVNHADQLKYLAGQRHWFGGGSCIILTTVNEDVLKSNRVEYQKYECKLLDHDDAHTLFCKKAFREEKPTKLAIEQLTSCILKRLGGHPLSIAVIGSSLYDKEDERYWRETEEMLKRYCHEDICKRLQIGYHRLGRNEQEIFVYLACSPEIDSKVFDSILEDIGLFPACGVDILIRRCLVNQRYGMYQVHKQLKLMCWEMIRKEFPDEPGKRKALISLQDIEEILTSTKGSGAIRIISDESYHEFIDGDPDCFSKMARLVLLRIRNVRFPKGLSCLPSELRILEWDDYPLKSFPPIFEPKHLFQLHMCCSQLVKLWEKAMVLPNLTSIDLSCSYNLIEVPDLSMAPSLKTLDLSFCINLVGIHQSVFVHNSLCSVRMSNCESLENLGCDKIDMPHLKDVELTGCYSIQMIPEFGERTQNLVILSLIWTSVKKLPESLGMIRSLKVLYVNVDVELPSSIFQSRSVKEIDFIGSDLHEIIPADLYIELLCFRQLFLEWLEEP